MMSTNYRPYELLGRVGSTAFMLTASYDIAFSLTFYTVALKTAPGFLSWRYLSVNASDLNCEAQQNEDGARGCLNSKAEGKKGLHSSSVRLIYILAPGEFSINVNCFT
jgi:hypothetical protein